ncbi:MAG: hypothetical protein JKY60_06830 [Kordiimonadaceae bacterium]|nr:hypothetical protein [Kordiimonadaceae bacterium]
MKTLVNVRLWVLGFVLIVVGVFLLFKTGEKLGHDGWWFLYDIGSPVMIIVGGFFVASQQAQIWRANRRRHLKD